MIYMEPHQLGWKPLVTSWMEHDMPDFITTSMAETLKVFVVAFSSEISDKGSGQTNQRAWVQFIWGTSFPNISFIICYSKLDLVFEYVNF